MFFAELSLVGQLFLNPPVDANETSLAYHAAWSSTETCIATLLDDMALQNGVQGWRATRKKVARPCSTHLVEFSYARDHIARLRDLTVLAHSDLPSG